ncbi:MAG TPA: hypothetical protein VLO07_04885 [Thermoanaerobaculia bacterium]|nr:hypothetical protein [Thermoanaerobaculia bacterium]
MTDACNTNRTDLFCGRAALVIWGIPAAILVATASWNSPLLVVIWPVLLAWMGGACLINAKRCGRRHCYATGPFFLALAVVSLLYGLRLLPLGPQGWGTLSIVLLVGSCVLTFVPEWIWGRYMAADHSRP